MYLKTFFLFIVHLVDLTPVAMVTGSYINIHEDSLS